MKERECVRYGSGPDDSNESTFNLFGYLNQLVTENIISQKDAEKNSSGTIKDTPPTISRKLLVNEADDDFYTYLNEAKPNDEKPWKSHPYYFQTVNISMLAMMKMTMHAISGGSIEIMGMLVGYYRKSQLFVLDCYPLPVQGTESRVNPQNDSYEFMLKYLTKLQQSKIKKEHIIGWYHSHPGFGCWLSGIDVQTQQLHQGFEDPYVAIVIDPIKSIQNGTIDIGAFRTFYENAQLKNTAKINDTSMGWHAKDYYPLDVKMFVNKYDKLMLQNMNQSNSNYSTLSIPNIDEIKEEMFRTDLKGDINENINETYNSIKILRRMNEVVRNLTFPANNKANERKKLNVNSFEDCSFPNYANKRTVSFNRSDASEFFDQGSSEEIDENIQMDENLVHFSNFNNDAMVITATGSASKTDESMMNDKHNASDVELLNSSLALDIDTSSQLQKILIQDIQRNIFK